MPRTSTSECLATLAALLLTLPPAGCATRPEEWEVSSRYEREIERPPLLDAPLLPASPAGAMPPEIVHVVGDVRFEPGSARLDAAGRARLDDLVAWVDDNASGEEFELEIQGHTDASGSDAGNERLAIARAEAVRRYLGERLELAPSKMRVVAAGSRAPAGNDGTSRGRAANRRVVVVVLR